MSRELLPSQRETLARLLTDAGLSPHAFEWLCGTERVEFRETTSFAGGAADASVATLRHRRLPLEFVIRAHPSAAVFQVEFKPGPFGARHGARTAGFAFVEHRFAEWAGLAARDVAANDPWAVLTAGGPDGPKVDPDALVAGLPEERLSRAECESLHAAIPELRDEVRRLAAVSAAERGGVRAAVREEIQPIEAALEVLESKVDTLPRRDLATLTLDAFTRAAAGLALTAALQSVGARLIGWLGTVLFRG